MTKEAFDQQAGIDWYNQLIIDGNAKDDALAAKDAQIAALREALTDIAVYGCGMLSQPAAMNGPEETWLKMRIHEYERRARAALEMSGGVKCDVCGYELPIGGAKGPCPTHGEGK